MLSEFLDLARRAHYFTSFVPEKRAEQICKEFGNLLSSDLECIEDEETKADYTKKFKSLFSSWMHRKSRCASTMITGGSNFNVRRNEKANNSERNAYDTFMEWRTRFFKRLNRVPRAKPNEALQAARVELVSTANVHNMSKEYNKIRKNKPSLEVLCGMFCESTANYLIRYEYPKLSLVASRAKMERLEARVDELEKKIQATEEVGNTSTVYEWGEVVMNREMDRIQFVFDGKPAAPIIAILKKGAYKWAPSQGAWQRQMTGNALWALPYTIKDIEAA